LSGGASRSTTRQYVAAIRRLLLAVEGPDGAPQWRDFERVLAHYRALAYPSQTQLCAAWSHFLAYQGASLPSLSDTQRGRRSAIVPSPSAPTADPRAAPARAPGAHRAACAQFLLAEAAGEGEGGAEAARALLADLRWHREGTAYVVRDSAGDDHPFRRARAAGALHYLRIAEYPPSGEPPEGAPLLPPERLVALLAQPAGAELRKVRAEADLAEVSEGEKVRP
jgi:hypothetical protein